MLPGSALPLNTGEASPVAAPAATGTETPLLSLLSARSAAATGACVSRVKFAGALGALALPAASVTTAVRLWLPSARTGEVKLQLPSWPTVTLPSGVPPSETVTMLPGSAVPLSTGALLLVRPSIGSPLASASVTFAAAVGATVSMVIARVAE